MLRDLVSRFFGSALLKSELYVILRFDKNPIALRVALNQAMTRMLLHKALQMLLIYTESQSEIASVNSSVLSLTDNTLSEGYVVGIRTTEGSINECAGVLIAPKYVLSANCKPNWTFVSRGIINTDAGSSTPDKVYASIGSNYNGGKYNSTDSRAGEMIRIVNWVRHPDYNAKTGEFNDFIFTLDTKSKYTPVSLPDADCSVSAGATVIATGFPTSGSGKLVSRKSVTTVSASDCGKTQAVYASQFCALTANTSQACGLNMGSPVVQVSSDYRQQDTLLGVANVNNGCSKAGVPVVFNQVAKIRSWIKSVTEPVATVIVHAYSNK